MSSLAIRRLVVWLISMVLGVILGLLILTFVLPALSPDKTAGAVSVQEYGIMYFLVTVIPIGLIFVTIFDHFLDTRIWPD